MFSSFLAYSPVIGILGTVLTIAAYLPQITHLASKHCSAGVSRPAYELWFFAAVLLLAHAFMIGDAVFAVLLAFTVIANAIIVFYAGRYREIVCESHAAKMS